jgi:uncharacterized protein YndB with AHSA1/START domain
MINVSEQINSVQRRVGTRMLEAGDARAITISQTYSATVEDVWDACTNPERIPRWFLPVSGELRLGGRYQLEGNAGGTVESCDPPRSFSATWEFGGQVSWIEVRVAAESEDLARLEIEHIVLAGDDAHWTQFGPGAVGIGWDMGMIGLALHLRDGGQVDRAAATEWMSSEEGRRFIEASSERWRDADVASGADPADAEAKARRTTEAYTAAPS